MKKLISLLLMAVMSLTILTGCGDPVYDEFEKYMSVDAVKVNENYTKITEEATKWGEYEEDEQMVTSITEVMLPLVNESLDILQKITLETEEVKNINIKYIKVMEAYRDGFNLILEGFQEQDADKLTNGDQKINEGITLLDEYNAALEELAEQVGATIE